MLYGEDSLIGHFAWTVWHEGVRIFRDGVSSGFRDINDIRNQSISVQSHNPPVAALIKSASNNTLSSLLPEINERVYLEFNVPLHFGWVAHHEGALHSFRKAHSEGRYNEIRQTYYVAQDHNPNARHLLAAMSDNNIARLVDNL